MRPEVEIPQKNRILVLSFSNARKPRATYFKGWMTLFEFSLVALVIG
jgi:hypothetical protein